MRATRALSYGEFEPGARDASPGTIVVAVAAPSPEANVGGTEFDRNNSGAVLDSIVLLALERSLGAYCAAVRADSGAGPPQIRAVVVTATPPVEPGLYRTLAARIVRERLPGARVRVLFDRQDGIAAPGYRIVLYPPPPDPGTGPPDTETMPGGLPHPMPGAPGPDTMFSPPGPDTIGVETTPGTVAAGTMPLLKGTTPGLKGTTPGFKGTTPGLKSMPGGREPGSAPPAARAVALTLAFGDWRWRYLLPDADQWLPFGRGLGPATGTTVRIPDFAAVVPRGRLLLIRHHAGTTRLHRCNERRDYLVRVDGRALPPGHSLPFAAAGRITYGLSAARSGAGSGEVTYKLITTEVR